jgi:hypothetical protein
MKEVIGSKFRSTESFEALKREALVLAQYQAFLSELERVKPQWLCLLKRIWLLMSSIVGDRLKFLCPLTSSVITSSTEIPHLLFTVLWATAADTALVRKDRNRD